MNAQTNTPSMSLLPAAFLDSLPPFSLGDTIAPLTTVSPEAAADTDRWKAYIDRIEGTVVHGWCCDAERPNLSLLIEAVATNGRRIVSVANLFRQDVFDAGFGSGRHGFCIDLAELAPKDHLVDVRFLESKVNINKEPISLDAQLAMLNGSLPDDYTVLMQQLAADLRRKHAEMAAASKASDRCGGDQRERAA